MTWKTLVFTVSVKTFPNQKAWMDKTICNTMKGRTAADNSGLASGHMGEHKRASYDLLTVVKKGKRQYGHKVVVPFQQWDTGDMWKRLRMITDSSQ